MTLEIPAALEKAIVTEAQSRGLPVEDYLAAILRRDHLAVERQAIEQEQAWWLGQPLDVRAQYAGHHVAVCDREVVDSDTDAQALRRRVRARFGKRPVLLMPAGGPREVRILSPRIVAS